MHAGCRGGGVVRAIVLLLALATAAPADMIKVGERFPDWTLPDQTGTAVSSEALAGKRYLLWFYPKAMTPGCTAEGQALRDRMADFRARGVEVLGVSFDAPKANAEFARTEGFPFRLLSDEDHALAVRVGAASSREQPVASRVSYLVGSDGRVLKAYDRVDPGAHAEQVLGDVRSRE
jgi:peroxiredoxin Q/BCP